MVMEIAGGAIQGDRYLAAPHRAGSRTSAATEPFEHTLNHLLDREIDPSALDAHYRNDRTATTTYPPAILLKLAPLAHSQRITMCFG